MHFIMCTRPLYIAEESNGRKSQHAYPRTDKEFASHPAFTDLKQLRREGTFVPCRHCRDCLINQADGKRIRALHEAEYHEHNLFITFTYDSDHLPVDLSLYYPHMQLLWKKLRNDGHKIRYNGIGEYGGIGYRPHYHYIVHGLELTDLEYQFSNDSGDECYSSQYLNAAWGRGIVNVGQLTPRSAMYVADHNKKQAAQIKEYLPPEQVEVIDKKTGEITLKNKRRFMIPDFTTGGVKLVEPPFFTCSTKPGIGEKWFREYWRDCFPSDSVIFNGKEHKVPEYYFKLLKRIDRETYEQVKAARDAVIKSEAFQKEQTPQRLDTKHRYKELIFGGTGERSKPVNRRIGKGRYHPENIARREAVKHFDPNRDAKMMQLVRMGK